MSAEEDIMVSVLVITFNHEKYVRQAIDSILAQAVDFKYEVLIGDDASIDKTQKILKDSYRNQKNVKLILRKKNLGPGKNADSLLERARGKYIFWMNGDDYWIGSNILQCFKDFLEEHKEYIGIAGRRYILSERSGRQSINYRLQDCNMDVTLKDFLNNKLFDLCATMYVNFYHDGKYDYKMHHYSPMVGDLTSNIHILLHGNLYQTDKIVGVYRTEQRGKSVAYNATRTSKQMYLDHIQLIRNLERKTPVKLDYTKLERRYAGIYIKSTVSVKEKIQAVLQVFRCSGIKVLGKGLIDSRKRIK